MRDQIKARASEIVLHLLGDPPSPERAGSVRYGTHGSLKIDLRNGRWFSHECGAGGDMVDLWAHVRECSNPVACAEVVSWLTGKPQVTYVRPAPTPLVHWPAFMAARWDQISWSDRISGYFRGRGINLTKPLVDVRYSPFGGDWMVCKVIGPDGEPYSVHKTFIGPVPPGIRRRKLNANGVSMAGGAIRLLQGKSDCAVIGEGIENALSYARLKGLDNWDVWSTLCAGNMPKFNHGTYEKVLIASDNDLPSIAAANKLAMAIQHDGGKVEVMPPDAADWNEQLMGVKL